MERLRTFIKTVLPQWWIDRIDLEGSSIRKLVIQAAQEIPPGSRILDSGAGQCPYRRFFQGKKYVSIDFALGEKTWDYTHLDVIGSVDSLPFVSNSFDAVLSTQVLEHVPEPGCIISEMYRILRPGGRVYLSAPQGFGEHQQPFDFFRFTQFGLRYLLEKNGFRIVTIQPRGGYFTFMAVMSMWVYHYLFPSGRQRWVKWMLAPAQLISALVFVLIWPPVLSILDCLDTEKAITLGYAVIAEKPNNDPGLNGACSDGTP